MPAKRQRRPQRKSGKAQPAGKMTHERAVWGVRDGDWGPLGGLLEMQWGFPWVPCGFREGDRRVWGTGEGSERGLEWSDGAQEDSGRNLEGYRAPGRSLERFHNLRKGRKEFLENRGALQGMGGILWKGPERLRVEVGGLMGVSRAFHSGRREFRMEFRGLQELHNRSRQ